MILIFGFFMITVSTISSHLGELCVCRYCVSGDLVGSHLDNIFIVSMKPIDSGGHLNLRCDDPSVWVRQPPDVSKCVPGDLYRLRLGSGQLGHFTKQ